MPAAVPNSAYSDMYTLVRAPIGTEILVTNTLKSKGPRGPAGKSSESCVALYLAPPGLSAEVVFDVLRQDGADPSLRLT